MIMENRMLLDVRSAIDSGLLTEIRSQDRPISFENFSLEAAVINNPIEEGLLSNQDKHLCTVNVGETLSDHLKYPLTTENQDAIVKLEVYLHGKNSCSNEDLEKYKELNFTEEAGLMHSPYLPPNSVHLISSVTKQHNSCSVSTSSVFSLEGPANQNGRMIPVFRSFMPPVAGDNRCYDQFKGIQNSTMQLQNLNNCLNESSSGICGLPQTSASVCDEIYKVRDTVSNVIEDHQHTTIFQSSNIDKSGCKLIALHSVAEESRCSQRNYSNPVGICKLEGDTQILCINSGGTQELKPVHLIPKYHNQHNYLQSVRKTFIERKCLGPSLTLFIVEIGESANRGHTVSDSDNPVPAVLGQFLPVPSELVLNEQEFENGPLEPVASISPFHLESNLHAEVKMTSERYCDCFANGDFCNSCNCNNCYNNQLHETEQFKAIKACLDRNPDTFLPKIGKRNLGEMKPHHNKGCNCKCSECVKNYCECLRQPAVCISWEELKAVCACLLEQAKEAENRSYSLCLAEQMIMEEFGRCLSQILHA